MSPDKVDDHPSLWIFPDEFDPERKQKYLKVNAILQRKIESGLMDPLMG